MITNKQLVAYAKTMLGHPYWYGCFGQMSSKTLYNSKKKQYPEQYQWACPASQLNTRVFDCIGLIKAAMWTNADPNKAPHYVKSQDVSANGMYDKCKKTGKISTLPEVPGVLVFCNKHVGIYIGGGYVIEARGHAYGVVKTELKKRPWAHWGLNPWIEYVEDKPKETKPVTVKPSTTKPTAQESKYYKKYTGSSPEIDKVLKAIGVPEKYRGSWKKRKPLAKANGISLYIGSAQQNNRLKDLAKQGKLKKA